MAEIAPAAGAAGTGVDEDEQPSANSEGRVSPTEKQFLEDLARATRLSLECYETEQAFRNLSLDGGNSSRNSEPEFGFGGRRLSHPTTLPENGSLISDKQQSTRQVDIKSRPRPFARATSTTPTTGYNSKEGSIIGPPSAAAARNFLNNSTSTTPPNIIQPPPTAFKRQRSLPHRHRHPNYPLQNNSFSPNSSSALPSSNSSSGGGDIIGASPTNSSFSPSPLLPFTNSNNNNNSNKNTNSNPNPPSNKNNSSKNNPNDDLILLVSPKVTPKFDKSNVAYFCDNLYSSPLDELNSSLIMSQNHSPSSPATNSSLSLTPISSYYTGGNNSSPNNRLPGIIPPFGGTTTTTPSPNYLNNRSIASPPFPSPIISPYPYGLKSNVINNNNNNNVAPFQPSPNILPGSTSTVIGNVLSGISSANNNNNNNFGYSNALNGSTFSGLRSIAPPPPLPILPSSSQLSKASPEPKPGSSNSSTSGSNRTSLYQGVFDQLKSLSSGEDLIDFGKTDNKNILEYFDPLVIREKWKEEQEYTRRQEELAKEKALLEKAAKEKGLKEKENMPSSSQHVVDDEDGNYNSGSIASYGSAATSAFSYRGAGPSRPSTSSASTTTERHGSQSMSLYPSLEEFVSEPLYGTLRGGQDDATSNFYDAYHPFEYLYTVSCSTPSVTSAYDLLGAAGPSTSQQLTYENGTRRSIGFSHFINQSSVPVIPPALPPRNSSEGSGPSSRTTSPTPTQGQQPSTSKQQDAKITLRLRTMSHDKNKRRGKLYENIESVKHFASTDSEIQAFFEMVRDLRFSCRHVDTSTNKGYVKSPSIDSKCSNKGLSLRIFVWRETFTGEPVSFTCDVSSTIDLVIEQGIMELSIDGSGRDYIYRVKGSNEYLDADIPLADYQYVQHCIKLDQDIQLVLVHRSSLDTNSWARTPRDDGNAVNIQIDDILPQVQSKTINYGDISIPLEVIDRESDRIKEKLSNSFFGHNNNNSPSGTGGETESPQLSPARFMQPVKAVCVLLGEVVTVEIVNALDFFLKTCDDWNAKTKAGSPVGDRSSFGDESRRRTKVVNDINSRLSYVEILPARRNSVEEALKDVVLSAVDRVTESVRNLVEMYSKSFPVSFRMKEIPDRTRLEFKDEYIPMSDMLESFLIRIGAIHRLKPEWLSTYANYVLTAEVFHGTRWMAKVTSPPVTVSKTENHWFFNTLVLDTWLNFEHLPVCILPRECRLVFTLFGRKQHEDNNAIFEIVELGWASMQCFNFKGLLAQGNYLLPFWPVGLVQKRLGPAPNSSFSSDGHAPLITIEFTDFGYDVYFPEIPNSLPISRDFQTLDLNTQVTLRDQVDNNTFTRVAPEDREVLWEKRHYLHEFPNALPKVLLAAQLWDWASIAELHASLQKWKQMDPNDAFQLLLPCFPDTRIREEGVRWISFMGDEELINLLPQLVEALSYETFDLSPLARFLLSKSLSSLQISHHFFWLLASQVGLGKWAKDLQTTHKISRLTNMDIENTYDPKRRRLELMLNSLIIISGQKWKEALFSEYKLIEGLANIAKQVKSTSKDSARASILTNELRKLSTRLFSSCNLIPLPVSPSSLVSLIDAKACSYFNSAALPLKITFTNGLPEGGSVSTIFKSGDDLRQDMLTIQTIRVIEKWWLKEGLDLRVLTFSCVPTGFREGMVEMVTNAETLCKIQAEYGVTGVFRDSAIAEWLAKMNPSSLDYRRAIDNFTLSCAAYCVVTYILGICDRHNDNIMLTKKGHLFHIDFGKFLGDAQMFGNFKRDRTPFVLTADMVYVINDGEKGSNRFHRFVELCCTAFRIIRRNGNLLLNLFALMATAGIPGVDLNSVSYIQNALLPDYSNVEAAAQFTRFIEASSQNWFTPVNFFLHSLAQLRFSSENDDPTKLTFVPHIYTMDMEGRIEKALLVSFQKKYDPEKYYLFAVKLKRKTQADWSIVNRTYKEFLELRTKLCINFPMAVNTLKPLPKGSGLGRANIKQVAARRKAYLQLFLESLFSMADEISHSDLVYTFFHPLLRDEEQGEEFDRRSNARAAMSRNPSRIHGQLKLGLEYQRGALLVLVLHAVDLTCPNGQPPSPYVKMYLQPDSGRVTKRKTRVVRRSQHPTFMEMIEYRLPMEIIRQKTLQVSVWHHDALQENNFLGGVSIKLSTVALDRETTETYILGNIISSA